MLGRLSESLSLLGRLSESLSLLGRLWFLVDCFTVKSISEPVVSGQVVVVNDVSVKNTLDNRPLLMMFQSNALEYQGLLGKLFRWISVHSNSVKVVLLCCASCSGGCFSMKCIRGLVFAEHVVEVDSFKNQFHSRARLNIFGQVVLIDGVLIKQVRELVFAGQVV